MIILMMIACFAIFARHVDDTSRISYPGGKCYLYRIYLSDKAGSQYSLQKPEEFLSLRSIKRREKQHLSLDSTDLPISERYIRQICDWGFEIVDKSKWNNTLLLRVRTPKDLKKLEHIPFVKSIKKVFESPDSINRRDRMNYHKTITSFIQDNESFYGSTEFQIKKLNGHKLHEAGYHGEAMMIAVLDGGFMNVDRIPAFHQIQLAGVADFVSPRSQNVFKEMEHGTMVLSVMAAEVEHYYVGAAPRASYVLVRCEDEQTESLAEEDYWASAVEYADSLGVDVINSSLGYHGFDDKTMDYKYENLDGKTAMISCTAAKLASKGIILVNSAGNEGMGSWKKINVPADASDILTVGAITRSGINAPFSSIGFTADGRVKPDVMAIGSPASVITGRGTVINDMGTSFSAPIIAGMVACLWQALPHLNAYEIMSIVKRSSDRYSRPNNIFGYGVPDFWKAYLMGKKDK
ncbi:MAG: S8 family serine peptidase [Prevotella sp.]|nr:S8 family serine peptidase [Prevotella sp.]